MLHRKNVFDNLSKSDFLKIVVICSLFFIILHFIRITILISGKTTDWFFAEIWNTIILPTSFSTFIKQVWSIISYMFVEMSFMKLLANMIWLWIFSNVLEDLTGNNTVFPIFLVVV
jgi:Rhomboid family.